jgi:hypothetical protein
MSKVIATEISAGMFHWDKETSTFSQEASSLGDTFNPLSQVWDDSCDEGFRLIGTKNKDNEVIYTFDRKDMFHGELYGWIFKAYPDARAKALGMANTRVLIIND